MTDSPKDFIETLDEMAGGRLVDLATADLHELVTQVVELKKKGSLVLTMVVEPAGDLTRMVAITGEVTVKPPKPAPEAGLFFAGAQGTLHRDDPFQERFPIAGRAEDPKDLPVANRPDEEGEPDA